MIAKLIFDLDNPGDKDDYEHTRKATDYYSALFDTFNLLRSNKKYEQGKTAEGLYDEFNEILRSRNIDI